MYILYLDDSGSIANKNEEYFVLGGVAVPEQSIRWLSNELEELAKVLDPGNHRQVEFHASEIFSRRTGIWKTLKKEESVTAIKSVLQCMDNAHRNIVVFACAVHKHSFPNEDPVEKAFEDLSSRFNKFLERRRSESEKYSPKGMIVFDKSTYEQSLQNLAKEFRHGGNRWGSQLRQICEVPLFVDSNASRMIQLADHIAYAVFRRYNAGDLTYYNCIESRFDQDADGRIYGLSHLQTTVPGCTCPACLSRRQVSLKVEPNVGSL